MPPVTLFAGNLAFATTRDDVISHINPTAEVVDVRIATDATGRSRGFGFVVLRDAESAARVQADLEGSELRGRRLSFRPATNKPRSDGPRCETSMQKPRA
jgi:nucleolin